MLLLMLMMMMMMMMSVLFTDVCHRADAEVTTEAVQLIGNV